jgi:hypothetical protein
MADTTIEGGMRADMWEWTLFIELPGVIATPNFGVWDVKEGGDVTANVTTYKPGGMMPAYVLGGTKETENVTFRRNYRRERDHARSQKYIDAVGFATVRAVGQPLDQKGNPWGDPLTYRGTLNRLSLPDHDSTSEDPAFVELEVTIKGLPTGMESK